VSAKELTIRQRAEQVFNDYINHHALYADDQERITTRIAYALTSAVQAEREACAKIALDWEPSDPRCVAECEAIGATIRERATP
jgi:hypothetical protein